MKVTREKAAAHRAAILKAASDLFRERGLDGVGVAEIMQAAGLTHGGFYGHFASKDALAAEACGSAFAEGVGRVSGDSDGRSYVARYVGGQRRKLGSGNCPMASLGSEISRQDAAVQIGFTDGVAEYLDAVTALMARSGASDPAAARRQAIATVSGLVGAMMLARATKEAQPALSSEILDAVEQVLAENVPAPRRN